MQQVHPNACSHCGSTVGSRTFAFREARARLFISYQPLAADLPLVKTLCGECWPKWLMWKARLGFDIHTHRQTEHCGMQCLAMTVGRANQRMAIDAAADVEVNGLANVFWIAKSMDGLDGVNGTTPQTARRVRHFLDPRLGRQMFYESLGGAAILRDQVVFAGQLREAHVPVYMIDWHQLTMEIFESAYTSPDGLIRPPELGEVSLGLHSVMLVGFSDGADTLHFVNTWGADWGDHGYGSVSMEYLAEHFREAWAVRNSRWGPTVEKVARYEAPSWAELCRDWERENPRLRGPHRQPGERGWREGFYDSWSPQEDCPVECLEVRNGIGLRAGWAFVYHWYEEPNNTRVSEIRELFVWPAFRRMGVGKSLEEWATARAREWKSSEIRLLLNETDSVLSSRTAARGFGSALGYSWRWRSRIGPSAVATGVKSP